MPRPMDLPEIFVLRHGETEWNHAHRMQGGLDSALTAKGRAQADAMGAALAAAGVRGQSHGLLSSPQGRALHTAQIANRHLGADITPDARLSEITMGAWSGLTRDQIDARWPGPADESFIEFYARAPGGESFESLWDRCGAVLAALARPTVIVTHGFTSRFLRTRALGMSLADLDVLPGGQGVVFHIHQGRHETLG